MPSIWRNVGRSASFSNQTEKAKEQQMTSIGLSIGLCNVLVLLLALVVSFFAGVGVTLSRTSKKNETLSYERQIVSHELQNEIKRNERLQNQMSSLSNIELKSELHRYKEKLKNCENALAISENKKPKVEELQKEQKQIILNEMRTLNRLFSAYEFKFNASVEMISSVLAYLNHYKKSKKGAKAAFDTMKVKLESMPSYPQKEDLDCLIVTLAQKPDNKIASIYETMGSLYKQLDYFNQCLNIVLKRYFVKLDYLKDYKESINESK